MGHYLMAAAMVAAGELMSMSRVLQVRQLVRHHAFQLALVQDPGADGETLHRLVRGV